VFEGAGRSRGVFRLAGTSAKLDGGRMQFLKNLIFAGGFTPQTRAYAGLYWQLANLAPPSRPLRSLTGESA
jgi:hypothetical protein